MVERTLTIPAMVRVGPWTLITLEKRAEWTNCERCSTSIKEVWTCAVDPAAEQLLAGLAGQREWRIGSVCGPTLLGVSEKVWKEHTRRTASCMRLLERVERLVTRAADQAIELPPLVFERRELLRSGEATDQQVRHLGLVVGRWAGRLEPSSSSQDP